MSKTYTSLTITCMQILQTWYMIVPTAISELIIFDLRKKEDLASCNFLLKKGAFQ